MMEAIGQPLGWLIGVCYGVLHNYVLAIVVFTLITKVILLPISLWTHSNSLKMVSLMPELNRLKIRYYGDKDIIAEETQKLYKKRGYHPLLSMVPMLLQIFLLMGVIGAVKELLGGTDHILNRIPAQEGGLSLLMPLAAGLAALTLTLAQNRINPLQREQSRGEQLSTGAISVGISLFLGAFVSLGTGAYWIASNLCSILTQLAVNVIIVPEKHVNYPALRESQQDLAKIGSLDQEISKEDRQRERADYKRFFSVANKHLVFYSEKSGFYKYFQNVIEYLLSYSNVIIHYITNDPKDKVFELAKAQDRIRPYYIGQKKLITLFMKMDADIVVMTTPGLENYYLKRSYIRKDIEYIYMCHALTSVNLTTPKGSYDHYDTIFCVGKHNLSELRESEGMYHTKEKNLVPCGYGLLDQLMDDVHGLQKSREGISQILIAPSWQTDNIMDSCIDPLLDQLITGKYVVIVRPHPEYCKRYPGKMKAFLEKYQRKVGDQFIIETDFSSNVSIFTSDLLITDWSGIAYEFSFSTLRPCLFINTPMKVMNPDYEKYKSIPKDIAWRNQVGVSLPLNRIAESGKMTEKLLKETEQFSRDIERLRDDSIFNLGKSGEAGGKYILGQLTKKQKRKQ